MRAILLGALLVSSLLAGCAGSDDPEPAQGNTEGPPQLAADRGGILGVLIDDIYRPVPGALVLLQEAGLTVTTDADGEFSFTDLAPGPYTARATSDLHEAKPIVIDVVAGEYTEVEYSAQRIFSNDGVVLTQQYSVFIACSAETLVYAASGINCNADLTGDSARTGFETDLRAEADNITYMVTEVKFNQKGDYSVVIGLMDSTNTYETYYAEADVLQSDYVKIVNLHGAINDRPTENVGGRNVNFTVDPPFETTIFPHGPGYSTFNSVCLPDTAVTNPACFWGLGPAIAVKANIVQSVFLGEPNVDIETYQVLSSSAQ